MKHIFVGTAGWSIASRHALDFSREGTHLERYARRLPAVEINSSFYRPHRRETYRRWADSVPETFRFSVKLPKATTHEKRLAGCEAELDAFAAQVAGLGNRLGVLLVQLPPNLAFEPSIAGNFLRLLRRRFDVGVAIEPRHASWLSADALLVEHRIARVGADPPRFDGADRCAGWPGLGYLRLHGAPDIYRSGYDTDAIERIAADILALRRQVSEIWCIFDNTALGHALGDALSLADRLAMGAAVTIG